MNPTNAWTWPTPASQPTPQPADDPIARLAHTLDVFADDVADDDWAIRATRGVYGRGVVTGITWGDLRQILAALADR